MGIGCEAKFYKPRRLEDGETLEGFSCGVELIDTWAAERAPKAKSLGSAVVYVSYATDDRVAGFYSLSSFAISRKRLVGGWLRRNAPDEIPVILLGMLGVATAFQGLGLGSLLLRDALLRGMQVAETVGAKALVVQPIDEEAKSFYKHFGFKELPDTDYLFAKFPTSWWE